MAAAVVLCTFLGPTHSKLEEEATIQFLYAASRGSTRRVRQVSIPVFAPPHKHTGVDQVARVLVHVAGVLVHVARVLI